MKKELITLHFENSQRWFNWLKENHKKDISLDMIFYKKTSGKKSIEYKEALEIALCFGWIDSRIKKIDETRYVRRFSKRLQKSRWSLINQHLMEKLIKANRVMPEALEAYNKARIDGLFEDEREKNNYKNIKVDIPMELIEKLKESKTAKVFFENLDEKSKNAYSMFIREAKKERTRNKRLNEMIEKLEDGWQLPYFRPVRRN